jgi:hypothetical protein
MILEWQNSKRPMLSFAFYRFFPHGLPNEPFWLYLYYSKSSSIDPYFQGKLRFRFQVITWNRLQFSRPDTYTFHPKNHEAKVWFLCDKYEEVSLVSGGMLAYEDFRHPSGKNLGSCLRNSIAPAICNAKIITKKFYP